jgi:protein phosphatase
MTSESRPERDLASVFQTGGATHAGHVRDHNEDDLVLRPDAGLWAVADGMGGHEAGAFASQTVAKALASVEPPSSAQALLKSCEEKLAQANDQIRAFAQSSGGVTVGTTVAVLLVFKTHFICLWCGDSRVYLIRRGVLRQLSRDHSELQEFVDKGVLTPDEAKVWPGRNVLTRAVGVFETPETDRQEGELESGDMFVLCSDGLTTHVADDEILKIAARRPAESGCQDLVDLALSRGGKDNVTVVIAHYRPDSTRRMPPPQRDAPPRSE